MKENYNVPLSDVYYPYSLYGNIDGVSTPDIDLGEGENE